jgi:NAD(P)-dependent dehydrogenase (short-subunit alcohol dehydrogenase family)
MAKIFITGSSDGLGLMAAQLLQGEGHQVVLHARNAQRGDYALSQVPGAEKVLTADLAYPEETKELAAKVNALGSFDAVIHNAGVNQAPNEVILAVNTLAPYILTCLIQRPKRLIYMSSNLHVHGDPALKRMTQGKGGASYADSKLHDIILCMAVARLGPGFMRTQWIPAGFPPKWAVPMLPTNWRMDLKRRPGLPLAMIQKPRLAAGIFSTRKKSIIGRKQMTCIRRRNFLPFVNSSAG